MIFYIRLLCNGTEYISENIPIADTLDFRFWIRDVVEDKNVEIPENINKICIYIIESQPIEYSKYNKYNFYQTNKLNLNHPENLLILYSDILPIYISLDLEDILSMVEYCFNLPRYNKPFRVRVNDKYKNVVSVKDKKTIVLFLIENEKYYISIQTVDRQKFTNILELLNCNFQYSNHLTIWLPGGRVRYPLIFYPYVYTSQKITPKYCIMRYNSYNINYQLLSYDKIDQIIFKLKN